MRETSIGLLGPEGQGEFVEFLREVDSDFPIPLSSKVDLKAWSIKVLSGGLVLAAWQSGRIIGVAAGYANDMNSRRGHLSVLAVKRDARGRGIGRQLVAEFERESIRRGMTCVSIATHSSNTPARKLYSGLHYVTDGELDSIGNLTYFKRVVWLTPERPNILLSSAGRRTYLVEWFREALGGNGEVHVSNSDAAAASLVAADHGVVSPLIYSDDYIPFMLDYCERERIGAIVPLFDVDIPVLAAHKADFEALGCLPIVTSADFARVCSDKFAMAELLASAGISSPNTYAGADGFLDAASHGESSFPAFIKPRWGMGSIGLAEATDEDELRVLCGIVERKVRSSYLRYESSADDASRSVIVQPRINAIEYGMDIYCDLSGCYQGCVVRKKIAMRAGETDIAEVVCADSRFEDLARSLSRISRHPGCMDVDVFDMGDQLVVLEMNARFGGGYPFSHAAGVDMPRALVTWLRGKECDPDVLAVKRPGVYMKDMSIVEMRKRLGEVQ